MCNKNIFRQLSNIPIRDLSPHCIIALLGLDFIFYHNGGMTLTKQVTTFIQNQNTFYNQSGPQKRGGTPTSQPQIPTTNCNCKILGPCKIKNSIYSDDLIEFEEIELFHINLEPNLIDANKLFTIVSKIQRSSNYRASWKNWKLLWNTL